MVATTLNNSTRRMNKQEYSQLTTATKIRSTMNRGYEQHRLSSMGLDLKNVISE
jgi:hypothetical protein